MAGLLITFNKYSLKSMNCQLDIDLGKISTERQIEPIDGKIFIAHHNCKAEQLEEVRELKNYWHRGFTYGRVIDSDVKGIVINSFPRPLKAAEERLLPFNFLL